MGTRKGSTVLGLIGFDSQSRRRRTRNEHLPAHCRRLSAQPGDLYTQSSSSRTHQQGGNDIYLNSVTLLLYHGGLPHARGQVCLIEPHPGRPIRPRRLTHLYFSVSPLAGLDFSHHFPQFPCPRSPQFKYAGRPLRTGNRAQQLKRNQGGYLNLHLFLPQAISSPSSSSSPSASMSSISSSIPSPSRTHATRRPTRPFTASVGGPALVPSLEVRESFSARLFRIGAGAQAS